MKRDIIKKLRAMGIYKADKPGCGAVHLSHLKIADLIRLLDEVTHK